METNKTVPFVYNFQNYDGQPSRIEYPISLPYRGDIRELSHEVVAKQMDPIMKMLDAHEGDCYTQLIGGRKGEYKWMILICRIVQTFEDIHWERKPGLL